MDEVRKEGGKEWRSGEEKDDKKTKIFFFKQKTAYDIGQ